MNLDKIEIKEIPRSDSIVNSLAVKIKDSARTICGKMTANTEGLKLQTFIELFMAPKINVGRSFVWCA